MDFDLAGTLCHMIQRVRRQEIAAELGIVHTSGIPVRRDRISNRGLIMNLDVTNVSSPCVSSLGRRSFLGRIVAGTIGGGLCGCGGEPGIPGLSAYDTQGRVQAPIVPLSNRLAMPGPFSG